MPSSRRTGRQVIVPSMIGAAGRSSRRATRGGSGIGALTQTQSDGEGLPLGVLEQAALAQDREHALADAVGLLQVRIAGEDELVDARLVVLGDAIGDLLVAAHQRGAGAAADEA